MLAYRLRWYGIQVEVVLAYRLRWYGIQVEVMLAYRLRWYGIQVEVVLAYRLRWYGIQVEVMLAYRLRCCCLHLASCVRKAYHIEAYTETLVYPQTPPVIMTLSRLARANLTKSRCCIIMHTFQSHYYGFLICLHVILCAQIQAITRT